MKKIFALLLAVVMTLGLLAGCGTAAETPDTEAPATEAPAAEEPAAEPTAKKIDTLKVDVLVTYADARRDYAERWNSEFGREGSIWEETGVIGVTAPIYNDTISVSKNSPIMDADLIAVLQQAFINIGNTDAGKQVIAIYSHNGYQIAQSSDYDNERAAQKLIQELSAAN